MWFLEAGKDACSSSSSSSNQEMSAVLGTVEATFNRSPLLASSCKVIASKILQHHLKKCAELPAK